MLPDIITPMKIKIIAVIIIVILALPVAILAGVCALLQSPLAVNTLATLLQPLTGIAVRVDDISFNHHLDARARGVRVKIAERDDFEMTFARADVSTAMGPGLHIEVEKMVLTDPKFTFHVKNDDTESDPFRILRRIPPVRFLEVKNGHLELKSGASVFVVPDIDMTIENFTPETGGRLNAKSRFAVSSETLAARGMLKVTLDASRFSPRPSGSGSLQLSLDESFFPGLRLDGALVTAEITLDGDALFLNGAQVSIRSLSGGKDSDQINVRNIKARFNCSYDQRTSGFALTSFEGSGTGIGMLKGQSTGTVKPLRWDASLQASHLDIAQFFDFASPLLPEEYRNWTFKGKSGLEVKSKGRNVGGAVTWEAVATIDLRDGGFASDDGSKAGERITGKLVLRLGSPEKGQTGSFDVSMECGDCEFLCNQYYKDFKDEWIGVVSQGTFTLTPFSFSSSGTLNLFQTGHYSFSTDISENRFILSLNATDISFRQLFETFIENHIRQNHASLRDIAIKGESDLTFTASISPQLKLIEGQIAIRDGEIRSASNNLMITGLNISLPYDLLWNGSPFPEQTYKTRRGSVAFDLFKKDNVRINKIEIPVVASGNRYVVPDPIEIKIFGGKISLADLRLENLLSPKMQLTTGMAIEHLKLSDIIGPSPHVPPTGTIDGDLPSIVFQSGKCRTEGKIVARIFGGRIAITNLFAGRILSPSRFFGADAVFDNIDLEAVTESVELGRMTGIIKGSLRNFKMEYGQPASFNLVITSDEQRKSKKEISVDAIKNLSIISTGSGAVSAILGSGLNQFFKAYPYSKIGIRCTLKNDIFSLRGLIREGDKEYLVKKAWLRGINIVNRNPENSISFKDMAERVGRIFQP